MISSWKDAIDAVLAAWDEAGLDMPKRQRTYIKKAVAEGLALPDSVEARIESAVQSHAPDERFVGLLDEVDKYYGEPLSEKQHEKELSEVLGEEANWALEGTIRATFQPGFHAAFELLAPLVALDRAIQMRSLSLRVLCDMWGQFKSLGLPRTLEEAEDTYEALLTLPMFYKDMDGEAKQAATAQMLFSDLLYATTGRDDEIGAFFKDCLKNCPDYLLDVPANGEAGTNRPASYFGSIDDADCAAILAERGSASVRKNVGHLIEYLEKEAKSAAALKTDAKSPTTPLAARATPGQEQLVALCEAADAVLSERHADTSLAPAVADEQIDNLNAALGALRLSEDAATLYRWHNGLPEPREFLGFPELLPIEAALNEYRESAEAFAEFGWSKAWFPIACEFDEFRFVILAEEECDTSPVYHFDSEDDTLWLEHESLEAMLRTYLDAIEAGVATFDEVEESYSFKTGKLKDIRKKYSPKAFNPRKNKMARYASDKAKTWPALWQKYKA
jgi:hypothetical protein